MSDPIVKSPFSDAVGPSTVPHKGTGKGSYGSESGNGFPGRDGGLLPELNRDTTFGSPKKSGPIDHSPFKDAVD